MSKTKYIEATGELYYARVFPQNIDDADFHQDKGGQFNCVFIPEDEGQMSKLTDAGFPESIMNYAQIKEYEIAGGRKGMKLKRNNKHPSIADFGGAPKVLDWTEGRGSKAWDFDVDGALGNGTKATVKVSIYTGGRNPITRLEGVAVLDHVEYEEASSSEMVW
jgi:hypothetical protein